MRAGNVLIKAPGKQLGILQLKGRSEANSGANEVSDVAYMKGTDTGWWPLTLLPLWETFCPMNACLINITL